MEEDRLLPDDPPPYESHQNSGYQAQPPVPPSQQTGGPQQSSCQPRVPPPPQWEQPGLVAVPQQVGFPRPGPYQQYGYQQQPGPYVYPPGQGYGATQNVSHVIVQQPPRPVVGQVVMPPPDYMPLSIFVCLCICCPIGICAILKSSESRNRFVAGDFSGAVAAAEQAKRLCILGIVCGLSIVLAIMLVITLAVI